METGAHLQPKGQDSAAIPGQDCLGLPVPQRFALVLRAVQDRLDHRGSARETAADGGQRHTLVRGESCKRRRQELCVTRNSNGTYHPSCFV